MRKYLELPEEVKYFVVDGKAIPVLKDEQGRMYVELPDEDEEKVELPEDKVKRKGGKSE
jgi:hypothetical protein